jgi:hypothetical protein
MSRSVAAGARIVAVVRGGDGRIFRKTATNGMRVTGWTGWQALP